MRRAASRRRAGGRLAGLHTAWVVGRFHYEVVLPADVEENGVEAHLDDGVLAIRLPTPVSDRPRRIQFAGGGEEHHDEVRSAGADERVPPVRIAADTWVIHSVSVLSGRPRPAGRGCGVGRRPLGVVRMGVHPQGGARGSGP